jgi:hypothetical protein
MTVKTAKSVFILMCFFGGGFGTQAVAKDFHFEVRLVWGTNQAKPEDKGVYELPKTLVKRMSNVFKWSNYYGVSHKGQKKHLKTIKTTKKVPLEVSKDCKLEISQMAKDGDWVEVKVFGEGKLLLTKKQQVVNGELMVVGGDCKKDDTAWFVILKPLAKLPAK